MSSFDNGYIVGAFAGRAWNEGGGVLRGMPWEAHQIAECAKEDTPTHMAKQDPSDDSLWVGAGRAWRSGYAQGFYDAANKSNRVTGDAIPWDRQSTMRHCRCAFGMVDLTCSVHGHTSTDACTCIYFGPGYHHVGRNPTCPIHRITSNPGPPPAHEVG